VGRSNQSGAGELKERMPGWVSFAEFKERVNIEQVLRSYRVDWLRHSGPDQYRGRCPIHGGEGRDAFHVNLKRSVFHCFACGAGGNQLDFAAALEGCSVREAALRLHQRYGLPDVGSTAPAGRPGSRREGKLVTKKREGNPALTFSLALNGAHSYLASRGLTPSTAACFGVGFFAGRGLLSGRIAIPVHDEHGRLIAYCGRALDPAAPRYRFPPGFQKSRVLFNYHRACDVGAAPGGQSVIIVEGFFDCMRVHQAGFPYVVGLMGAVLSGTQRELIVRRFSNVTLLLDADATGRSATVRIAAALRPFCAVTERSPGSGCQPDQLSADQIRQILMQAEGGQPGRTA
jgi:DNA primase